MITTYAPPIDRLLSLGPLGREAWLDYRALGIGPEHVTELLRMVTDDYLLGLPPERPDVWAPAHALRALGQLRDPAAVERLLARLGEFTDETWDEYFAEDLPVVLGLIGPPAIPAMTAFFQDATRNSWSRAWIAEAFYKLGQEHPEARGQSVAILTQQLEKAQENTPNLNASIVAALVELKATESRAQMEAAFARGLVDETFSGDWRYVQYDLGLSATPPAYQRGFHPGSPLLPARNPRERAEARRKKAKTERKRQRRK